MPRALWKGAISFGLVTIPVSLYPAKDAGANLAFHLLHRTDLSRIHNTHVDEQDHEVPLEEIVRGYEYDKDRYVIVDEADLKAANVEATQTIDIMHFVGSDEIDVAFFDTPYYTEPAKMGRKAYALLRETLRRTRRVGVAKIVIKERQHLCAVVADGPVLLACTLRWPYQLRPASDLALPGDDLEGLNVSPRELNMAEQLVQAMTSPWDPGQYRDTYHDDVLALIERKVKGGEGAELPEPPRAEVRATNVVDLSALLKQSVEQHRSGQASG